MKVVHVPKEIKARVNAEIERCISIANHRFSREFAFPTISYTLRGQVAGYARQRKYLINLNSVLLMENTKTFIGRTVPHEFAHLVDGIVYPGTRIGSKRSIHGNTWKSIMCLFGADSSRCHSYDVTNSRKSSSSIVIRCSCGCGKQGTMGAKRTAKWRSNPSAYFFHRGHLLIEVGTTTSVSPTTPPAPKRSTKLELAIQTLKIQPSLPRRTAIQLIQVVCDIPAGAATYYYQKAKSQLKNP